MRQEFVILLLAVGVLVAPTLAAVQRQSRINEALDEKYDISDDAIYTIAVAIGEFLIGFIPVPGLSEVASIIFDAFAPTAPAAISYWDQLKDEVMQVVGNAIQLQNLNQILAFKDDLGSLIKRYGNAPVNFTETYPNKNMMAESIHTAIISNRYLIEASEGSESLFLHFLDIAALHSIILEDVAQTYSWPSSDASAWWQDLRDELNHYTMHAEALEVKSKEWRLNQIRCRQEEPSGWCTNFDWFPGVTCYDYYTVTDSVNGNVVTCEEEYTTSSPDELNCHSFLKLGPKVANKDVCNIFNQYRQQIEVQMNQFVENYAHIPIDGWKSLLSYIDNQIPKISHLHNPANPKEESIFSDRPSS